MKNWIEDLKAAEVKLPMPVLSFPGVQLTGDTVEDVAKHAEAQANCMAAIAKRYQTSAAVSNMDLSVEAEAFGGTASFEKDDIPNIIGRLLEDGEDIEKLAIPEVGDARTGEYIRAIELALEKITDRPVLAGVTGPYSMSGRLTEMTEIMYMAMDDPDAVHMLLDKVTTFLIKYILKFKEIGAHGVVLAEPAAGLLSPDWNCEFSIPYVKRIIDAVQDDSFAIVYHNCGTVEPLLDDIISLGAKALHFGNTSDLAELIKHIPEDILVMGNIDPVSEITYGSKESITSAVKSLQDKMAEHKNFVLSSGCDIPPQASLDNIDYFFQAAKRA